jgi:beta-lactam-binding protein with PASTA domain
MREILPTRKEETVTAPLPPDAETNVLPPQPPPGGPPAPEDYEPSPARGLGWGMLLGALVLVAVAGAIAAVYFITRDDGNDGAQTTTAQTTTVAPVAAAKIFVPDVKGLKQDEAAQRLGAAHLVPVVEYKPTKKPTGLVVTQDPAPAKRVKRGTSVTIVVDRGAPSVAIPDVTGLKVADAGKRLADAKLKAQTTEVTAADKPAGTVVSQAPAAGEKVKQGSVVTLSIAKAPPASTTTATTTTTAATTTTATTTSATRTQTTKTTAPPPPANATVPDLSGNLQAASQALSEADLLASVQYVPSQDTLGTVVQQSPAANATVKARSHVTVNVSSGPGNKPAMTVPDTTGQTLDQAVSTLNGAGLRLIFVKVAVTTRSSVGKVVEQTPKAGSTAPKNAQVLVYLGVLG